MTNSSIFSAYGIESVQDAIELREKFKAILELSGKPFFGIKPDIKPEDKYDRWETMIDIQVLTEFINSSEDENDICVKETLTKKQRIKLKRKFLRKRAVKTPQFVKKTAHGIKPVYKNSKYNVFLKKYGNHRIRKYGNCLKRNGYKKLFRLKDNIAA